MMVSILLLFINKNLLKNNDLSNLIKTEWREIVAARNLISHEYFGLNYSELFDIVTQDVPKFHEEILIVAHAIKNTPLFKQAIEETEKDLIHIGRKDSVSYSKNLQKDLYSDQQ